VNRADYLLSQSRNHGGRADGLSGQRSFETASAGLVVGPEPQTWRDQVYSGWTADRWKTPVDLAAIAKSSHQPGEQSVWCKPQFQRMSR